MKELRKLLLGLSMLVVLGMTTGNAAPFLSESPVSIVLDDPCSKTGADENKSREAYSLYREFYKQKNYVDAMPHWRFVVKEAPGLRKTTFINGITMYKSFMKEEADSLVRDQLLDTVVMLYNKRIECHGEKGKVTGLMAMDLYKYRPMQYDTLRYYFRTAIEESGEDVPYYLFYPYFQYVKLGWQEGKLTDDQIVAKFEKYTPVIEAALAKAEDEKAINQWTSTQDKVARLFPGSLMTCERIIQKLNDERDEIFGDLSALKKNYNYFKLAPEDEETGAKCTDDPMFAEVVEGIYKQEPNATIVTELAYIYAARGEMDRALELFNEAIELEDEVEKKATLALSIAKILKNERKFSDARSYARKALEHKPDWGAPYILIGDMYASSGSICGGQDGELCALAAVDKYARAKSVDPEAAEEAQQRINKYSAYFPTKTYLFERSMSEGSSYTFGCWIGETTTLRGKRSN